LNLLDINPNKNKIYQSFTSKVGQVAVLIDPEKCNSLSQLGPLIEKAIASKIDYLFVGGSTVSKPDFDRVVELIKSLTDIPLVIFPGSHQQISNKADALLYLSLLSGRNPEYLIGQHVNSALEVVEMQLETIPTAYVLVDGGRQSSVAYVSQTTPIPQNSPTIALRTAVAGVLQGKQLVFFDAGSGAVQMVPTNYITDFKQIYPDIPVIIGGGVREVEDIQRFKDAGANVVVIGNKIEEEIDFLLDLANYKKETA
jgi:phosphoglycerol geranylgeranyltransferase